MLVEQNPGGVGLLPSCPKGSRNLVVWGCTLIKWNSPFGGPLTHFIHVFTVVTTHRGRRAGQYDESDGEGYQEQAERGKQGTHTHTIHTGWWWAVWAKALVRVSVLLCRQRQEPRAHPAGPVATLSYCDFSVLL